jgi:hypothetical protein
LRSAQFRAQLPGDVAGDLLLKRYDLSGFALILFAPDFSIVLNAGEIGAYLDGVAALRDPASQ